MLKSERIITAKLTCPDTVLHYQRPSHWMPLYDKPPAVITLHDRLG